MPRELYAAEMRKYVHPSTTFLRSCLLFAWPQTCSLGYCTMCVSHLFYRPLPPFFSADDGKLAWNVPSRRSTSTPPKCLICAARSRIYPSSVSAWIACAPSSTKATVRSPGSMTRSTRRMNPSSSRWLAPAAVGTELAAPRRRRQPRRAAPRARMPVRNVRIRLPSRHPSSQAPARPARPALQVRAPPGRRPRGQLPRSEDAVVRYPSTNGATIRLALVRAGCAINHRAWWFRRSQRPSNPLRRCLLLHPCSSHSSLCRPPNNVHNHPPTPRASLCLSLCLQVSVCLQSSLCPE
jgi:hypothetical protein